MWAYFWIYNGNLNFLPSGPTGHCHPTHVKTLQHVMIWTLSFLLMSLKNENIFLFFLLFPACLINLYRSIFPLGFPGGWDGIPGLGRSPGEGNDYPLQYSGLENSMDRGAWQATVQGVTKSQTRLSDFHFHISIWEYFYSSWTNLTFFLIASLLVINSQLCLKKKILYFIYKRSFGEN